MKITHTHSTDGNNNTKTGVPRVSLILTSAEKFIISWSLWMRLIKKLENIC